MKKKNSYKKIFNAALVTAMTTSALVVTVPGPVEAAVKNFPDVKPTDHFYEPVQLLTDRGIIRGLPDGTFKPYNKVTRGQAAKILALTLDLDTVNVKNPGFKDIPKGHEYYGPIAALVAAGIITGYEEDQTYRPGNPLTRAQMSKILTLGFDFDGVEAKGNKFTDVPTTAWYADFVETLLDSAITTGTTSTTFSPSAHVTRGQMTSFVIRSEKVQRINEQIKEIEKLLEKDYTAEAWAVLQAALEAAKKVSADASAKQAEVEAALKALEEAVKNLSESGTVPEVPGQMEELKDLIKSTEGFKKEYFTEKTWANFELALNTAKTVSSKVNSTAEQMDAAYKGLDKAIKELEVVDGSVVVKDLLRSLVNRAEGYQKDKYTTATWSALEKAIKDAKTVLDNASATQKGVDSALANLDKAIDGLALNLVNDAEDLIKKAEDSKTEEDYNNAKDLIDQLPNGPEKDKLVERLKELLKILQSAGPEALLQHKAASLFTEPIITTLPNEEKTSGGLVGLNLGVVDLGLLSGNQISDLSKNKNNVYQFTVDKDHERDVKVSVAVHTVLGGKKYSVNVYRKTGENELTRIDLIEASGGGALGIAVPKEHDLGTFEEGEYTVLLALEGGLTVIEVVPFKMYDVVDRDYSQVSTENSIVSGNLLDKQQLGATNAAVISTVQVKGQATSSVEPGKNETAVQGKYGTLHISQDGSYRYVPANNKAGVGQTDTFEYTIKNTYNNKVSKNDLQFKLEGVNTPR